MDSRPDTTLDRRTVLALLGSASTAALAGCSGGGGDGTDTPDDGGTDAPDDAVPAEYETATALNGVERSPGSLSTKADVSYQSEPLEGQQCSGCAYYVPDRDGDGQGACAIVEGTIDPSGYCVSYVAHETTTGDGTAESEAVAVPEDASCAVCGMQAAQFPEWNAQAVHDDGTRAFFCTSGCALTYHAVTDQFADTDADVADLWVRDLESRELIEASTASFALETDAERLDDPMKRNPAPFADREDALAYVDAVAYLSEADVIELSAFGREEAVTYRGNLIE